MFLRGIRIVNLGRDIQINVKNAMLADGWGGCDDDARGTMLNRSEEPRGAVNTCLVSADVLDSKKAMWRGRRVDEAKGSYYKATPHRVPAGFFIRGAHNFWAATFPAKVLGFRIRWIPARVTVGDSGGLRLRDSSLVYQARDIQDRTHSITVHTPPSGMRFTPHRI